MEKTITLDVVQGIGDIFWIYQKLSPYFDRINLNVCVVSNDQVQLRAREFLSLFPKVWLVTYKLIKSQDYDRIAHSYHPIKNILDRPDIVHPYACNKPLEDGKRIEDIDPSSIVEWDINLSFSDPQFPWNDYAILYVSGSKPSYAWDAVVWAEFVKEYLSRSNANLPIILIGAIYDQNVLLQIDRHLVSMGMKTNIRIGMSPKQVIGALRSAKIFFGYQSGLNVIADNFDVKQVMLYFPFLHKMINTWSKQKNVDERVFQGFTFDTPVANILDRCDFNLN